MTSENTDKTYVYVYKKDKPYDIRRSTWRNIGPGDPIIFMRFVSGGYDSIRYVTKTHAAFSRMKMNNLDTDLQADESCLMSEGKYNMCKNKDVVLIYEHDFTTDELKKIEQLGTFVSAADTVAEESDLADPNDAYPYNTFWKSCRDGGEVSAMKNTGGTIGEIGALLINSISHGDPKTYDISKGINIRLVTAENAASFISIIAEATEYESFNYEIIFEQMWRKFPVVEDLAVALIMCLIVYVSSGNNSNNLLNKRKDLGLSKKIMEAVNNMGVERRFVNKNTLTLSRIAITFPGTLYLVRQMMKLEERLSPQFEGPLEVEFQDLAFSGYSAIANKPGYDQFYENMSAAIWKEKKDDPKPGVSRDDATKWAKFERDQVRWRKISVTGFELSKTAKPRLIEAYGITLVRDEEKSYFARVVKFAENSIRMYKGDESA